MYRCSTPYRVSVAKNSIPTNIHEHVKISLWSIQRLLLKSDENNDGKLWDKTGCVKNSFFSKLFRLAEYRIDFQNLTPTTLYVRRTVWRPAKSNWADWTVQLISEKYRRVGLGPGGVRRWLVNRRGCGPWWKISQAVCVPLSTLLAAG